MKRLSLIICLFFGMIACLYCQDSTFIKVHFLYGSKPKAKFKTEEPKWFGGKLGGHVGIELEKDRIINFLPSGSLHIFSKKEDIHGQFVTHSEIGFWSVLGGDAEQVKKATFVIPILHTQRAKLDSISRCYLDKTPYDYAFFGMRCGASTYEILAQLGILEPFSNRKTYWKIFYPKKLRKRLFKLAKRNNWTVLREEGSDRRKWERD